MTKTEVNKDKIILFCKDDDQETKYVIALLKEDNLFIQFFNLICFKNKKLYEYFYKFNSQNTQLLQTRLNANEFNFLDKLFNKFNSTSSCEDIISFADEYKIKYEKNEGFYSRFERYNFKNGTLKKVTALNEIGICEGETILYYPNKKIKNIFPYHKGKLHGLAKQYFKNEEIQYEYNYKNGLRNGYSINYKKETGEIENKIFFRNGKFQDLYTTEGVIEVHNIGEYLQYKSKNLYENKDDFSRPWNGKEWIDPIITNVNHTILVSFAFNTITYDTPFIINKLYNINAKNYINYCQQENCFLIEDGKLLTKLLKLKNLYHFPENIRKNMFSILVKIIALCNYGVNNAILSGKNITILDKDDSNINLIEINNQIIENNKIKEDLYNYNYSFNVDLLNCSRDIKFLTDKIIKNKVLNFSMCIYGDPGTGKSAYAKFLAKKLGLDIVCKSAADILDPYVGNSEKLIKETFQEAKEKHAVLIIDEIDSFLRSRSLAQRNWEVSMVNQMLTCMESFSYPFICTTNFIDTLDQASLRRFTFKFKFGFLKQNQIESAFSYIFNCKPSETILKMQGLTISDIVNIKKECDILGIIDINEISNMLEENLVLKKSGDLRKNIGFN